MSEAVIDAGTNSGSSTETVESSQSTVDTSSQSSGANLNGSTGNDGEYWYSEGIDGFYGPDGQPVLNSKGDYVRTQNELDALLGNAQTQTAKTQQQKPVQQGSQQKVSDTLFETDGKYDSVKSNSFLSEIDKPYSPTFLQSAQKQQPVPVQQQGQQLPNVQQQVEQPKSLSEQVMEYESGLRSNLLDPLLEARDDMIEAGRWKNENPRAVKLNQLINERSKAIEGLVKEKQLKLWEESFTSKDKEAKDKQAAKELEDAVNQSVFNVSKKYGGQEMFETLMIGKQDASGKLIAGSGQDLVMAIIDILNEGQVSSDVNKSIKDGWNKIAKHPEILATVAKYVSGYHIAKNLAKNNEQVRQAALAEERKRQTMVGKQPQSIVPSQQGNSGMPKELSGWLGVSTV